MSKIIENSQKSFAHTGNITQLQIDYEITLSIEQINSICRAIIEFDRGMVFNSENCALYSDARFRLTSKEYLLYKLFLLACARPKYWVGDLYPNAQSSRLTYVSVSNLGKLFNFVTSYMDIQQNIDELSSADSNIPDDSRAPFQHTGNIAQLQISFESLLAQEQINCICRVIVELFRGCEYKMNATRSQFDARTQLTKSEYAFYKFYLYVKPQCTGPMISIHIERRLINQLEMMKKFVIHNVAPNSVADIVVGTAIPNVVPDIVLDTVVDDDPEFHMIRQNATRASSFVVSENATSEMDSRMTTCTDIDSGDSDDEVFFLDECAEYEKRQYENLAARAREINEKIIAEESHTTPTTQHILSPFPDAPVKKRRVFDWRVVGGSNRPMMTILPSSVEETDIDHFMKI